jgi:hypothetical protein
MYKLNTTAATERVNFVVVVTAFPTTQDATNYLNTMNKTAYNLTSTKCGNTSGGAPYAYLNATGHAPQICKDYERETGTSSSSLDYRKYVTYQLDNLIIEITGKSAG